MSTKWNVNFKTLYNNYVLISEIGVGLAGFGISFLFLGMLLLFDKGLLAIGNVRTVLIDLWKHPVYIIMN